MRPGRPLRMVFMGTPEFAATVLAQVLDFAAAGGGEVVAVYTQPDRPCGRGRTCTPPPVKRLALERSLPVRQPLNFKDPAEVQGLRDLNADVLLVAAYGLILPQSVLDVAPLGAINVHASLLPKYRGAAPIQRAILAGEPVTGITIMQMERGLDSGPMLLQRAMAIGIDDTAADLHDQLAAMGGELLVEVLTGLARGEVHPMVQNHERATHAAKLTKDEGRIDFSRPVLEVHNRIRAMHPWPGAFFDLEREGQPALRVGVMPGSIGEPLAEAATPGSILGVSDAGLAVACADRAYLFTQLKPQGRKLMDARAFYCGYLSSGDEAVCRGLEFDTAVESAPGAESAPCAGTDDIAVGGLGEPDKLC